MAQTTKMEKQIILQLIGKRWLSLTCRGSVLVLVLIRADHDAVNGVRRRALDPVKREVPARAGREIIVRSVDSQVTVPGHTQSSVVLNFVELTIP